MPLVCPLNSKFWWDLYIFPNLAVHFHLMPLNSSSNWSGSGTLCDSQRSLGTIHLEHESVKKKKSTVAAPWRTLRDRTTLHKGQESTSACFSRSLVEIQFRCTQNYRLHLCTPIRMFVTLSFFLVLETFIYFSFPTFRCRYRVIYFHSSAHKNFLNIIPNRHMNCLFLWSPTSTTSF